MSGSWTVSARALSIYSFGIPIGSAIGIVFGGIIASLLDWRIAFFIVGLADNLLVLLVGWELVTVMLFLMINQGRGDARAGGAKAIGGCAARCPLSRARSEISDFKLPLP